jgi:hypothetical protein
MFLPLFSAAISKLISTLALDVDLLLEERDKGQFPAMVGRARDR